MARLHFDSQKLPPFLIGYLIDSRVGEREIIATVMDLIVKGDILLQKKQDGYHIRKTRRTPKNRFEELILEAIGEKEARTDEVMPGIRARKKEIYQEFKSFLEGYYHGLTKKKKSNFSISFSFSFIVGDKALHELERTYGENRILPNLPDSDKKALLELTDFLKSHPVNPENVAAEFMPYSVALGLNDFWMKQFKAKPKQRSVPLEFDEIDFLDEDEPSGGSGFSFSITSKSKVEKRYDLTDKPE